MSNFTNKNIMSNGSTIEITDKQLATFKSEAETWNAGEVDRALDDLRIASCTAACVGKWFVFCPIQSISVVLWRWSKLCVDWTDITDPLEHD